MDGGLIGRVAANGLKDAVLGEGTKQLVKNLCVNVGKGSGGGFTACDKSGQVYLPGVDPKLAQPIGLTDKYPRVVTPHDVLYSGDDVTWKISGGLEEVFGDQLVEDRFDPKTGEGEFAFKWAGRTWHSGDLAAVVGAPPGTVISVESFDFNSIGILMKGDDFTAYRSMSYDPPSGGRYPAFLTLNHEAIGVKKGTQQKGLGTKIVASAIRSATLLGFNEIGVHAIGDADMAREGTASGYIVWPKLGFDCPFAPDFREQNGIEVDVFDRLVPEIAAQLGFKKSASPDGPGYTDWLDSDGEVVSRGDVNDQVAGQWSTLQDFLGESKANEKLWAKHGGEFWGKLDITGTGDLRNHEMPPSLWILDSYMRRKFKTALFTASDRKALGLQEAIRRAMNRLITEAKKKLAGNLCVNTGEGSGGGFTNCSAGGGTPAESPNDIVKILRVVDTREYEEVSDHRWEPVAGSGDPRQCSRCNRTHLVHAYVQTRGGDTVCVGTGCMKGSSVEPEIRAISNRAKSIAKTNAQLAKAKDQYAKAKAIEDEVAKLPLPTIEGPIEKHRWSNNTTWEWKMGDAFVWDHIPTGKPPSLSAERHGTLVDGWRDRRAHDLGRTESSNYLANGVAYLEKRLANLMKAPTRKKKATKKIAEATELLGEAKKKLAGNLCVNTGEGSGGGFTPCNTGGSATSSTPIPQDRALFSHFFDGKGLADFAAREGSFGDDKVPDEQGRYSFFGGQFKATREQLARLFGAPRGSRVWIWEGKEGVEVRVSNEAIGMDSDRTMHLKPDGVDIDMELMTIREKGKGWGARIFATTVKEGKALGITRLNMLAGGDPTSLKYNGYDTWAKFGVDGPIPTDVVPLQKAMADSPYKDFTRVSQFQETLEGRRFWTKHGFAYEGTFELQDPSFVGWRLFDSYLKHRHGRGLWEWLMRRAVARLNAMIG